VWPATPSARGVEGSPEDYRERASPMTMEDALLFIDTNIYLDLYHLPEGKPILDYLVEQGAHVFVTQRVVEEVKRQKIKAVATLLVSPGFA
jgi:hypothetical protein